MWMSSSFARAASLFTFFWMPIRSLHAPEMRLWIDSASSRRSPTSSAILRTKGRTAPALAPSQTASLAFRFMSFSASPARVFSLLWIFSQSATADSRLAKSTDIRSV